MEKNSKTEKPVKRSELVFFIEDGKLIRRTVTEVIESIETVSAYIPIDIIKKHFVIFNHTQIDLDASVERGFRMYYSDVIKGEKLKELLFDEDGELKETIKANVVKADTNVTFTEAEIINDKTVNRIVVPNREYRIVCYHNEKEDRYVFNFFKSSYFMFRKLLRLY